MTVLAIMQPAYLPWMGYFELMARCDDFIILDDVQYTKQDWRNRNRIRTKDGWCWLTVPVRKGGLNSPLNKIAISDHSKWAQKHLQSIAQNYRKAPFFDEIYAILEPVLSESPPLLCDLTIRLIRDFAAYLGITPKIHLASQMRYHSDGPVERILALCKAVKADVYYTGAAAADYLNPQILRDKGIETVFQDYQHPHYTQGYPGFESHMAIIDVLMNHGPKARELVLSSPAPKGVIQ